MGKFIDITNQRFGRLLVIERSNFKHPHRDVYWLCQCDCGNKKNIKGASLRAGTSKSCGCLTIEKTKERIGDKSSRWKGGRTKRGDGYILVNSPHHPNTINKNGQVYEHVFVMSQKLGRAITKNESIHHKNGIRDDNRPENLELRLNNHHPKGQSVEKDLIPYWKKMLEQYAPELLR
jgi:hypothetical protein